MILERWGVEGGAVFVKGAEDAPGEDRAGFCRLYHNVESLPTNFKQRCGEKEPLFGGDNSYSMSGCPHLEDADVQRKASGSGRQLLQHEGSEAFLRRKQSCFSLVKCPGPALP